MKTTGGPGFEQYFRNAAQLVMEHPESGNTLIDVGRVFSDKESDGWRSHVRLGPLGGDVGLTIAADMKEDLASLTTYARTHDGKILEEWNYLENFFKVMKNITNA